MSPTSGRSGSVPPWARAHWKDLLCVLALALLSVTARMESLDRVNLNPDEAQYEATASFLAAEELSPFALSYGSGGTFMLFKTMARLFGPYPMFETRVLVLLLSLAMALMLYAMVRTEAGAWCGLASGLVFVHFNVFFEGLTANREWFASFFLLLGVLFYWLWDRRTGRGGWWLIFCSGALTAVALWFKLHAAFMVLPIAVLLAWRALSRDETRRSLAGLLLFAAGGLAATGLYLVGFLLAGTLGAYLGEILVDFSGYTMGNVAAASTDGEGPGLYLANLYSRRPFRPLLLAAAAMSAIGLVLMGLRVVRRRAAGLARFEKPLVLLFALFFADSLITISLGERFFEHYYLFWVFPVAGLAGLAIHAFAASPAASRALRWIAAVWLALWVVDRAFVLRHYSPARIAALWPESLVIVLYVLAGAAILVLVLPRPRLRLPLTVAGLICLEVALVTVQGQVVQTPRSLPHHRQGFAALEHYFTDAARPGDRLFVWGWAPEVYSVTGVAAATQFSVCQYFVNDTAPVQGRPRLDEDLAANLMRELEERKPRFIVDASKRSWTMQSSREPWIYDLRLYPEFGLVRLLRTEYYLVGVFDGCRVYERR